MLVMSASKGCWVQRRGAVSYVTTDVMCHVTFLTNAFDLPFVAQLDPEYTDL